MQHGLQQADTWLYQGALSRAALSRIVLNRIVLNRVVLSRAGLILSVFVLGGQVCQEPLMAQAGGPIVSEQLQELPIPNLEAEEPEVRAQLQLARQQLDARLAASKVTEGRSQGTQDAESIALLAGDFAELGRLYYLYEKLDLADIALSNALILVPEATDWSYLRAVVRSLDGKSTAALEEFEAIVSAFPENVPALVRTGNLLYDLGQYEAARGHLQRAVALAPEEVAALAGLGQVAFRLGEQELAVELLERALALQPSADSLYYPLAQSLRALGRVDPSRQALKRHGQGAVMLDDPVIDGLGTENRSSQALLHAGNRAMRRGEMAAAAGYFRRYILRRPDHALATHNLGLTLLAGQQREEGLRALRKAVVLDPEFRGGHYFLAAALAEDGRFEEALGHYRKAHEIDPQERSIHADYATLLARMGRVDEALLELAPVVETDPDAHYVHLKYATILASVGRQSEAEPLLVQASRVGMEDSQRAEALYHLGLMRLNENRVDLARERLEQSLELAAGSGPANVAMAQLLGRSGDFARSAVHFERALKAQPYDVGTHFGYAMSLLLSARDAAALKALETAVGLLPEQRSLHHLLARLLATSSDETVRDGARAVKMTEELVEKTQDPDYLETLAMALAETGRFSEAVSWQKRAVQRGLERRESAAAQRDRQARVIQFEQGKPVRNLWELR